MPRHKELTRECALLRQPRPVADLIRFVAGPDGTLVPDIDARAPGRGVWISATTGDVNEAVRKKVFARSLKHKVNVPDDLAYQTRSRLEQRLTGALGLARKAGQFLTGATRVRSAIGNGTAKALFTATDAADDGRRKMLQARRAAGLEGTMPHFEVLTAAQLGLALGLENVIHAALTEGAAAKSALARAQRLARYIAQPDG